MYFYHFFDEKWGDFCAKIVPKKSLILSKKHVFFLKREKLTSFDG